MYVQVILLKNTVVFNKLGKIDIYVYVYIKKYSNELKYKFQI